MHPSLPDLYELHLIDTRIQQLKKALSSLDDGAAASKALEKAHACYADSTTRLRKLKADLQDAELNLKTVENKKSSYRNRLRSGAITNFKEVEAMEHEIGILAANQDQLEDKILTLMDEIEVAAAENEQCHKDAEALESRLTEIRSAYEKRKAELDAELADVSTRRAPAAARINPAALQRYEQIRARSGIGMAVVEEGSCSGCRTTLTHYSLREAAESEKLVTCENCNRILFYMAEEK